MGKMEVFENNVLIRNPTSTPKAFGKKDEDDKIPWKFMESNVRLV
jgi:hypothetical protein